MGTANAKADKKKKIRTINGINLGNITHWKLKRRLQKRKREPTPWSTS
jgi:hypothetical protein